MNHQLEQGSRSHEPHMVSNMSLQEAQYRLSGAQMEHNEQATRDFGQNRGILDKVLQGLTTPVASRNKQLMSEYDAELEQSGSQMRISNLQRMLRESAKQNARVFGSEIMDPENAQMLTTSQFNANSYGQVYNDESYLLGKRGHSEMETPSYNNQSDYYADMGSKRKANVARNVHKYITPYNAKFETKIPESMITSAYTQNDVYNMEDFDLQNIEPGTEFYNSSMKKSSFSRKKKNIRAKMPSRPPVIREGDWLCSHCNNINWAKRTTCNLCNHQRPNIEKISYPRMLNKLYEVNSWSCCSCGNIVKGEHKFCPTCGFKRTEEIEKQMEQAKQRKLKSKGQGNIISQIPNKKKKKKGKGKRKNDRLKSQVFKPKQGYVTG